MPITASCGNCGKTYQAPDRMAGKNVRCKACGEVFRIDAPDAPPPEGGIDLDELEKSFGGETLSGSMTATHTAPSIDPHGRVKIAREGNPDAFTVRDDEEPGPRTNLRYRYPGAKQVDQLLPWALVAITAFVIVQASLSREASSDGPPSTAIGLSRAAILLVLYAALIWPASHMAMSMASRKLRFAMPHAPLWRTFAGFTPVLMMGAGLYILSGGETAGLVMGLFVGITLAVGAVALLFRVFPNELPIVGGYAAGGAATGSVFTIALMIAANVIGVQLAGMSKTPTLFTSPIAIGMPWIAKPPTQPGTPVARKPTDNGRSNNGVVMPGTTALPKLPGEAELMTLDVPPVPDGEPKLVRAVQETPVIRGFDLVLTTPVNSDGIAIVRSSGGGTLETWNRSTWQRPDAALARNFEVLPNTLFINTTGRMVVRLVKTPVDRLEELPLGNAATIPPLNVVGDSSRVLVGFLNDHDLVTTIRRPPNLLVEQYDLAAGRLTIDARPFRKRGTVGGPLPLAFEGNTAHAMRIFADGKSVIVAARDPVDTGAPARLYRYDIDRIDTPRVTRTVPLNSSTPIAPIGLAVSTSGTRAALLLNTGNEGYLTIWDVAVPTPSTNPASLPATEPSTPARDPSTPILDRKVGLLTALRPDTWDDASDPLIWLDDRTVLLYGRFIYDAETGKRLGATGLTNIRAQVPGIDALGRVLLIQSVGGTNSLLRVTFDANAIKQARGG